MDYICWVLLDINEIYLLIGLVGRVFTNGLGDWGSIPSWVIPKTLKKKKKKKKEKKKRDLISRCLTLGIISYVLRVKWSNPEKGVAPSPTLWCSSYWKGSLQVALDYSRQLYFDSLSVYIIHWTLCKVKYIPQS